MEIKKYLALPILMLAATTAHTATTLTLSLPGTAEQIQQTSQTPSIFGAAVPTQPPGFGYEKLPTGGGSQTYDAYTGSLALDWNNGGTSGPDYTVAQIISVLGGASSFNVGIDVNTTNAASEVLQLFEVKIDTGSGFNVEFICGTSGGAACGAIPPNGNSNGTGWSDYLLSTVDLSGFSADDKVQFHTIISGAVDGQEQLFLTAVPVPAAVWLFGSGLIGLVGVARRKKS